MAKTTKRAALNELDPDRRAAAWEITKRAQAAALADRREGCKLAITMLRELEASPELCDLCAIDEFVTGERRRKTTSSCVTWRSADSARRALRPDSAQSFRISSPGLSRDSPLKRG